MARKSKATPAADPEPAPISEELLLAEDPIQTNVGRATGMLEVTNRGDRHIQVGSHLHFFEVNRALVLDRAASFGRRLNIPSGQAVRFEPGQTQRVTLVALGGKGLVHGCNRLTKSSVRSATQKRRALARLQEWMG